MNKLLDFGRKAMFYVRVLTGIEERRIRAYRLQLQERMEKAQARKAELRKNPDEVILSEVRRVVQEMQALNKNLEETEAAIDEYFKPIDKNVHTLMNMQLDKEESHMKEMIKAMQEQAMHQNQIASRQQAQVGTADRNHQNQDTAPPLQQQQAK